MPAVAVCCEGAWLTGQICPATGGAGGQAGAGAGGQAGAGAGGQAGAGAGGQAGESGGAAGGTACETAVGVSPFACELEGCTTLFDIAITCDETSDQGQTAFALTEGAAYLYVALHNDGRLFEVTPDGATADETFPFRVAPARLAANHAGELFVHGFVDGAYLLGRGTFGAFTTAESQRLSDPGFLDLDSAGEPGLFGRTGTEMFARFTALETFDMSWIGEAQILGFDGAGAAFALGYEPLHADDDHVYVSWGESPLALVEDASRGRLFPAPIARTEPGAAIRPEVAFARLPVDGLWLGWIDGGTYAEALLAETTVPDACPSGHYGACEPDCEEIGTRIEHVAGARDSAGNAYVAFVHATVSRTITGAFDPGLSYCNYNPSRDDTVREVRVVRLVAGTLTASEVLTVRESGPARSLRLATHGDDLALAVELGQTFRVVRFRTDEP
jgi:hypothetical protein